jgi:hypothetical protein
VVVEFPPGDGRGERGERKCGQGMWKGGWRGNCIVLDIRAVGFSKSFVGLLFGLHSIGVYWLVDFFELEVKGRNLGRSM